MLLVSPLVAISLIAALSLDPVSPKSNATSVPPLAPPHDDDCHAAPQ
jgi:hypothetical protein